MLPRKIKFPKHDVYLIELKESQYSDYETNENFV